MTRLIAILTLIFSIGLPSSAANDPAKPRLILTESAPGTMSTLQYCMLVFPDRSFHAERANRRHGNDRDRKVYEGQLSESDWSSLNSILDAKEFREMKVVRSSSALMVENSHPYTISVEREKGYQNMEFITDDSVKPYEHQVKPLLRWWKSVREGHLAESKASPDPRCSPDTNSTVFSY